MGRLACVLSEEESGSEVIRTDCTFQEPGRKWRAGAGLSSTGGEVQTPCRIAGGWCQYEGLDFSKRRYAPVFVIYPSCRRNKMRDGT